MPATASATPHTLMNQISKGRKIRPRRVMLYGTHGIGKSTFKAMAEKPIFRSHRGRPGRHRLRVVPAGPQPRRSDGALELLYW